MIDSIKIGWQKQSPNEVQFSPNIQGSRQHVTQQIKNQHKKPSKKKVLFNLDTPIVHQAPFQSTKDNRSGTIRKQRLIHRDLDYTSSSTNIFAPELLLTNDKQNCSVRATVITFIIVILIIIAAAIAIGIIFASIKSQQNTSGNTTGTSNQNSLSTVSTTVVVSSVSIGSQSGAPCSSYTTINDPSRNVAQTGLFGSCDNGPLFNTSNGGSWIQFVGTGGTMIPLTSPGVNHCGGYLSGWFNDTLPTTMGTVTNGTVYFDVYIDDCRWSISILVAYCGSFYAYFLPPAPVCNARYCTD